MDGRPIVSVIIPTRNRKEMTLRAIKSVLSQSFQKFELIIVDDNSDDGTFEAVSGLTDDRLRIFRHDSQRGGGASRNTGILASTAEIIAFLDSDDEWKQNRLEKHVEKICNSGSDVGLIYSGFIRWDDHNNSEYATFIPKFRGKILNELLIENCVGTTSCVSVKKDYLIKAGLFDESLHQSQEWDLWIRMAEICDMDYISEVLTIYHIHNMVQISDSMRNRYVSRKQILAKYMRYYEERSKLLAHHHLVLSHYALIQGMKKDSVDHLILSLKSNPFNPIALLFLFLRILPFTIYNKIFNKLFIIKLKLNII